MKSFFEKRARKNDSVYRASTVDPGKIVTQFCCMNMLVHQLHQHYTAINQSGLHAGLCWIFQQGLSNFYFLFIFLFFWGGWGRWICCKSSALMAGAVVL